MPRCGLRFRRKLRLRLIKGRLWVRVRSEAEINELGLPVDLPHAHAYGYDLE